MMLRTNSAIMGGSLNKWQPIIKDKATRHLCETALSSIASSIKRDLDDDHQEMWGQDSPESAMLSLGSGYSAASLFLAYYGHWKKSKSLLGASSKSLAKLLRLLAQTRCTASLFQGFTGTLWTFEHLRATGMLHDIELEETDLSADRLLIESLNHRIWEGKFDLIDGLVGVGVYAMERLPNAMSKQLLDAVLDHLSTTAEYSGAGACWFTPRHVLSKAEIEKAPAGYFNVGMAHGITGIIGFLARAQRWCSDSRKCQLLLESAVSWLRAQRNVQQNGMVFPSWVTPTGERLPSRLGWCYGDLSISVSLMRAALCADRGDWWEEGVSLARGICNLHDAQKQVDAPYVCHGSAGVALIFARLYHATGYGEFKRAALSYADRTISFCSKEELSGFEPVEPRLQKKYGLLTGVAGLGLVLLALLGTIEPAWDRVLLLDLPPHSP
jgi:lantibiotic modifying enzyme